MPSFAPIVLFAYIRPQHTRRLLESLAANDLAAQSELWVFVDAPKPTATDQDLANHQAVLDLVQERAWCGQVHLRARPTNLGLAKSITSGVSEVVGQYGRGIVLEDDLFVAPGFLRYMNDALDLYAHDEQVMHVSGFMYPIRQQLPDTFFYTKISCWGWATWQRAWQHFDPDARHLYDELERQHLLDRFNLGGAYNFSEHLLANATGQWQTWAIKWQASVFLRRGLCLSPHQSLVRNLGFDGSGEHCHLDHNEHSQHPMADHVPVARIPLKENPAARSAVAQYYLNLHHNYRGKLKYYLKKLFV
jgi:Glycosyl transferase family 2